MPTNLFVTFSPDNSKWSDDDVKIVYMMLNQYLRERCEHYYSVCSPGGTGEHYHFHTHIVKLSCSSKTFRRHVVDIIESHEDLPKGGYFLRLETQKGTMSQVGEYMQKNVEEGGGDEPTFKSPGYDEYVNYFAESDKVLAPKQFLNVMIKELEEEKVKQGGLDKHLMQKVFERVSRKYYLFKIDDFTLQRIANDLELKYSPTKSVRKMFQ